MKTSINSLIAIALTATVLTTSAFTSIAANTATVDKVVTKAKNFKRISVKGNVELLIVQGNTESIKFAEDNYGTAKVTQSGDLLTISSTNNDEKVKMVVYVNDIYRIQAADNAVVSTEGTLNTKFLQVFLSDEAKAEIKTNTESIYTVVDNYATLKLKGATQNHTLANSTTSEIVIDKFASASTVVNTIDNKDEAIAHLSK